MIQLWLGLVGATAAIFTVVAAIAKEDTTRRFAEILIGREDVEAASSAVVRGLVDDALGEHGGSWSLRRIVFIYCGGLLPLMFFLRLLNNQPEFSLPGTDTVSFAFLLVLQIAAGGVMFALAVAVGHGFMSIVERAGDFMQIVLGFVLIIAIHALYANFYWLLGYLRIGYEELNIVPMNYGSAIYALPQDGLTHPQNGLQQIAFAQYLVAFMVPFLFWVQVILGNVTRFMDRLPQSVSEEPAPELRVWQKMIRLLIGWWGDAEKQPFLVAGLIGIFLESWVCLMAYALISLL